MVLIINDIIYYGKGQYLEYCTKKFINHKIYYLIIEKRNDILTRWRFKT